MPNVNDIKIDNLPTFRDARGDLVAVDFARFVPFPVARLFYVRDVPINTTRGQHAHRQGWQYLICQVGRVLVDATDGARSLRMELTAGQAVLMESGIFFGETYLERETVLLVLCDRPYDRKDYIESMEEFLAMRADLNATSQSVASSERIGDQASDHALTLGTAP